jgi:NAD(P)H dehydrogenase (quinone)
MTDIAIIYFSGTGHTHLMAESISTGAQTIPDTKVQLLRITGEQIVNGRWKDEAMVASLNNADEIDRLSCELYGQRIAKATQG